MGVQVRDSLDFVPGDIVWLELRKEHALFDHPAASVVVGHITQIDFAIVLSKLDDDGHSVHNTFLLTSSGTSGWINERWVEKVR